MFVKTPWPKKTFKSERKKVRRISIFSFFFSQEQMTFKRKMVFSCWNHGILLPVFWPCAFIKKEHTWLNFMAGTFGPLISFSFLTAQLFAVFCRCSFSKAVWKYYYNQDLVTLPGFFSFDGSTINFQCFFSFHSGFPAGGHPPVSQKGVPKP